MKRTIIPLLFLAIAAAVSCTKETAEPVENKPVVKTVSLVPVETKTAFGSVSGGVYPVEWTSEDTAIAYAVGGKSGESYTVGEAARTANPTVSFNAAVSKPTDGADFNIVAVSPQIALKTVYVSGTKSHRLNVEIPSSQACSSTGPDPKAQVIYAKSGSFSEVPEYVNLAFHHITSYLHINFKNVANPENVVSVTVSSEDLDLSGRMFFYTGDSSTDVNNMLKSITVVSSSDVNPLDLANVWVGLAPVDLRGKKLSFEIVLSDGGVGTVLKKDVVFPSDDKYNLLSGVVGEFSVNMSGIDSVPAEKFVKVTDASELSQGDEIIIVSGVDNAALSTAQNANNRGAAGISTDGSIIWNPSSSVQRIILKNSYFTDGGRTGEYSLSADAGFLQFEEGGNYLRSNKVTSDQENSSWKITFDGSGNAQIKTASSLARQLKYNSGSNLFSCYTSGQSDVQIYKNATHTTPLLWYETWAGGTKSQTPAEYQSETPSTFGSVTYSSDNGKGTKAYTRLYIDGLVFLDSKDAGTEANASLYLTDNKYHNNMIGNGGGYLKVDGINCDGIKKALLTYYCNTNLDKTNHLVTASTDVVVSSLSQETVVYNYTYDNAGTPQAKNKNVRIVTAELDFTSYDSATFWLQFTNNATANIRTSFFEVRVLEYK